jgi:hypothetical protein
MNEDLVQKTANDAARAKTSMSRLGYYNDSFISYFLGRGAEAARVSPLINRGYYARFKCIDTLVRRFLVECADADAAAQVVVFGGGSDTMYFRYVQEACLTISASTSTSTSASASASAISSASTSTSRSTSATATTSDSEGNPPAAPDGALLSLRQLPRRFVELDLVDNAVHKATTIARTKELAALLGVEQVSPTGPHSPRNGDGGNSGASSGVSQAAGIGPATATDTSGSVCQPDRGVIRTNAGYHLMPCDLRRREELDAMMKSCDLDPVSFVECPLSGWGGCSSDRHSR